MKKTLLLGLSLAFCVFTVQAQETKTEKKGYEFTTVKEVKYTPVKNQNKSGTCWSFSALGVIESELLRTGKGEFDLSEMFIVRNAYFDKFEKYVRFHGAINFSAGGANHDIPNMIKKYGIVPEEVYTGLQYGKDNHIHEELDKLMDANAKVLANIKNPTIAWPKAVNGILDAYLGSTPQEFTYNGKKYTPITFAQWLGLNWDDYIEISSFTHHSFYTKFIFEVPDNWSLDHVYNLPLDEMIQVIDNAINSGYSVGWGSDVSEKGFSWRNGVAIIPDEEKQDLQGTERERWEKLTDKEKAAQLYTFDSPIKEKEITQEMRQISFDNFETTDDHGMQIVGIAKDQNGGKYYIVKNSWGTDHIKKGFFYASEAFVKYKTMNIMINKNCLSNDIKKKLKL